MDIFQLRAQLKKLPVRDQSSNDTWVINASHIVREAIHSKEETCDLLRWATIRKTMFVGNAPYIKDELAVLKQSPEWSRYESAIREDDFGLPEFSNVQPDTSGNMIHQAYHLHQWESFAGKRVEDLDTILEIGGGYGAMAKLCRRLGFKGEYYIYDLPEFSLIQRFYLSNTIGEDAAICVSDPTCLPATTGLYIAIYSLSEIPAVERWKLFRESDGYLIAFQDVFDGVDNYESFTDWNSYDMKHIWEIKIAIGFENLKYMLGCPLS